MVWYQPLDQRSAVQSLRSRLDYRLADESFGVVTGKVQMQKHVVNGAPVVFANANAINSGTATGSPIRLSYPGEARRAQ